MRGVFHSDVLESLSFMDFFIVHRIRIPDVSLNNEQEVLRNQCFLF